MAKILGPLKVSGGTPKMIETPDNFIINSQVYDKNSFSAKALEFCPITGTSRNEILLYRNVYIPNSWVHNRTDMNFMIDSGDPNIVYLGANGVGIERGSLYKIQKTVTGYNVFSTSLNAVQSTSEIYEFVSQDSAKIYGFVQKEYSSYVAYFFAIDKATFTVAWTNLGTATSIRILKETESAIYFASSWNSYNYITKYNKGSGSTTTILSDYHAQADDYRNIMSPLNEKNEFFGIKDGYVSTGNPHKTVYRKYTINTEIDTASYRDMIVDMSIKGNLDIIFNTATGPQIKHELFYVKEGGKTYLNHMLYNNGTILAPLTADKCAIHTYEITGINTMKLVSFKEFNPIVYKGMLLMYENKLLLLGSESGVHFFNWNAGSLSFERTNTFDVPTLAFGCDMNNNIYIQNTDTSVEMLSNTLPIMIYADFQYDAYTYNGVELDAVVEVYTRNFMNEYLSSSIELTLFGPVRFADTGLKKKTVTTSNVNKSSFPVIVSGEGILKVNTKVI